MQETNIVLILILILIPLFLFIKTLPLKNKEKIFLNISFILFFIVLIIREPYSDMVKYNNMFLSIKDLTFHQVFTIGWERLYLLLNYLIGIFTNDTHIFMTILAFLGLIGPYFFIKKYSKGYFFSIIFYLILEIFGYNVVIIRQALAISVILFSIKYIVNKSFFKFLLTVIIASFFHKTAAIFIIAYPICNLKLNKSGYFLYSLFALIVFILKSFLVKFVYIDKYVIYNNAANSSDGYGKLIIFILIFISMLFIYYSDKRQESSKLVSKREKGDVETVLWGMFMIAIVFQILATEKSLVTRVTSYFSLGIPVIVSNNIFKIKNMRTRTLICSIILICCILYAFMYLSKSYYVLPF